MHNDIPSPDWKLAWVAGLIEGEGWMGAKGPRSANGSVRPTVQVISTDEDVVRRLREWTGVGNVTGPNRGTKKPIYRWYVSRREEAGPLIERILPLLCERRAAKAREVLERWRASPPKRGTAPTCSYGHDLIEPNLYYLDDGRRRCRACEARRTAEYRERQAALPESRAAATKRLRKDAHQQALTRLREEMWELARERPT